MLSLFIPEEVTMAQKNNKNKFYVTTPIYYVTAKPHLGSLYSTVLADVVARWHKMQGTPTFFLTGTDEHGQKIAQAAQKAGKDPKTFVDEFIPVYKEVWRQYETDYTHFIRTTDDYHVKAVQDWIRRIQKRGDIYKGFYKGWYCVPDETFVAEKSADTEQAPLCPSCGRPTIQMEEETYFFRLSVYQDKLLKFYEEHPDFITPKERAHEIYNIVKGGLKDLSISRTTISWGIPFPDDPKHVVYVWVDALNNYITAAGYGQPDREAEFRKWWPADVQILGKDIIRFHAIYWPAFLMAAELPLPKKLLVHGWITVNQQKMSKSLGNMVDPMELQKAYGAQEVRYYLVRHLPVTHDSDFSIADLEQHITSELANDLGNLLNRMGVLAEKYNALHLPVQKNWDAAAQALQDQAAAMLEATTLAMADYSFHMALNHVWAFINQVNAYFHEKQPWKIAGENQEQFIQVLSATAHSLHLIARVLWPIMPHKMEELCASLGKPLVVRDDGIDHLAHEAWNEAFTLTRIAPLFEKHKAPALEEQAVRAHADEEKKKSLEAAKAHEHISIEDFSKVQLVVGTIEHAEAVEGSDKLLKLQVNCGQFGMRQILSGVKQSYAPEMLMGIQGVFVLNLKPRKLMGLESQGMMLFAEGVDGKQKAVTVSAAVPVGTRLR
jgi:methionyl-tRNA synthetase